MKITAINMKNVKKGENPFYTVKWSDASKKKEKEIYSIIEKMNNTKVQRTV